MNEGAQVLVHCSDLHFGHGFLPAKAEKLAVRINELSPDAVIVSGDLTMRARRHQFEAAREFLNEIHAPKMVIPGNHDVPLYDVATRLVSPFALYREIAAPLDSGPLLLDRVAAYGVNTVNPFRHQQGRFRERDLEAAEAWSKTVPDGLWKLVVVHQHFANLPGHERPGVMPRGQEILERLSNAGIHAVLHGHVHYHHVASTAEFFPSISRPMVLVCSGTPTCHRVRGDDATNNYNVLTFHEDHFEVCQMAWSDQAAHFVPGRVSRFDRAFFREPDTAHA